MEKYIKNKIFVRSRKEILNNIEHEISVIASSKTTCSPIAEFIAVKYNLYGTVEEAVIQLGELWERLKKGHNLTKDIIRELTGIMERTEHYTQAQSIDPYIIAVNEAVAENDWRKYNIMFERRVKRMEELHERKECICYN